MIVRIAEEQEHYRPEDRHRLFPELPPVNQACIPDVEFKLQQPDRVLFVTESLRATVTICRYTYLQQFAICRYIYLQ